MFFSFFDFLGIADMVDNCDHTTVNENPDAQALCAKGAIDIASLIDPTGIVGLCNAFVMPICDVPRNMYGYQPISQEAFHLHFL